MTAVAAPAPPAPRVWAPGARVVLTPRRQVFRFACLVLCVLAVSLLLELLVASNLQQRAAQQRMFDAFRSDLASGTAPVGPATFDGKALAAGAPVAYLEIPAIGLRQVVGEGSDPATLFDGPGHRRDTPLPGQIGTSVVMGRRGAFGGPFRRIGELGQDAVIKVTTATGVYDYKVLGVRREGERAPSPIEAGDGRLTLVTAAGRPFMPNGVLRVDAEIVGQAVVGPARNISAAALPASEQIMGASTSTLWALALWLQLLTLLTVGAVYAWHRWGRAKAWVVFLPPMLLVGLSTAGEAARVMPNLL